MVLRAFAGTAALLLAACAGPSAPSLPAGAQRDMDRPAVDRPASDPGQAPAPAAPIADTGRCDQPVPVRDDGRTTGEVCPAGAHLAGLTVVDLSDEWAPRVFDGVDYRDVYIALADEREQTSSGERVWVEQYLELFGIFPTFGVLRRRAGDEAELACSDAVDGAALDAVGESLRTATPRTQRRRVARVRALARELERERDRRGLESIDALAGHPRFGAKLERYREEKRVLDALGALQGQLACEGLLDRHDPGVLDQRTARAIRTWQRRHMIIPDGLFDEHTRRSMALGSRELLFRAMLRTLRERVVDAAGLIEDGTAGGGPQPVLGRDLDGPTFLASSASLAEGAGDVVSRATEAAARALGWTDPDAALAALRALPPRGTGRWRVAIRLPTMPAYYAAHMELRAEIDRGDMRFGRAQSGDRRPMLVLYAQHDGQQIPLIRWSTTIGGWQNEQLEDGSVVRRFKESPAGPVIWRDIVAAPVWLPPPSTPDRELVQQTGENTFRPKRSLFGPGYRSAYGLAMMMHHKVVERDDGTVGTFDEGVRTHGSVSYGSIVEGHSHGCHRLFNHLAIRLAGFLLAHRRHVRHGTDAVEYARNVVISDEEGNVLDELTIRLRNRGHRYELTPPVNVEVLEGTIHEWGD